MHAKTTAQIKKNLMCMLQSRYDLRCFSDKIPKDQQLILCENPIPSVIVDRCKEMRICPLLWSTFIKPGHRQREQQQDFDTPVKKEGETSATTTTEIALKSTLTLMFIQDHKKMPISIVRECVSILKEYKIISHLIFVSATKFLPTTVFLF
jgi:hypothetical protein